MTQPIADSLGRTPLGMGCVLRSYTCQDSSSPAGEHCGCQGSRRRCRSLLLCTFAELVAGLGAEGYAGVALAAHLPRRASRNTRDPEGHSELSQRYEKSYHSNFTCGCTWEKTHVSERSFGCTLKTFISNKVGRGEISWNSNVIPGKVGIQLPSGTAGLKSQHRESSPPSVSLPPSVRLPISAGSLSCFFYKGGRITTSCPCFAMTEGSGLAL